MYAIRSYYEFASYSNEQVTSELESYAKKIRSAGWSVYYIKLPFPENATITALDGSTVSIPAGSTAPDVKQTENAADGQNATASKAQDGRDGSAPAKATEYVDVSGSFTEAVGIGTTSLPRITSYNVCYTKLLRWFQGADNTDIDGNGVTNEPKGFTKELEIIINMESQSWLTGSTPSYNDLIDPSKNQMKVDWVRVYKPVTGSGDSGNVPVTGIRNNFV